uniref:Uncharacterized protein n=1 Tax=Anguilla anguilla TaxID=7936 RepID=A0A0E9TAY0_ANGAN
MLMFTSRDSLKFPTSDTFHFSSLSLSVTSNKGNYF